MRFCRNRVKTLGTAVEGPFTDVRITWPPRWDWIEEMGGLVQINLKPPASGPEIELTIMATEFSGRQDVEDAVRAQIEAMTRSTVLAMRQREE